LSILFGASSAAAMAAFRLPAGGDALCRGVTRFTGLLRMLGRFAERRRDGGGLHSDEIQRLEPMLTDELVQQMLGELCEIGLLRRAESGEWLLGARSRRPDDGRPVRSLPVADPGRRGTLAVSRRRTRHGALAELDQLRLPLRDLLKRRVSAVYDIPPTGTP
jgi:membrane protein